LAAVCRDDGTRELAAERDRRSCRAKRSDFRMAIENLICPVADRARIVAKQLVEHRYIVRHERLLVAVERRPHLRDDIRQVNFHCVLLAPLEYHCARCRVCAAALRRARWGWARRVARPSPPYEPCL